MSADHTRDLTYTLTKRDTANLLCSPICQAIGSPAGNIGGLDGAPRSSQAGRRRCYTSKSILHAQWVEEGIGGRLSPTPVADALAQGAPCTRMGKSPPSRAPSPTSAFAPSSRFAAAATATAPIAAAAPLPGAATAWATTVSFALGLRGRLRAQIHTVTCVVVAAAVRTLPRGIVRLSILRRPRPLITSRPHSLSPVLPLLLLLARLLRPAHLPPRAALRRCCGLCGWSQCRLRALWGCCCCRPANSGIHARIWSRRKPPRRYRYLLGHFRSRTDSGVGNSLGYRARRRGRDVFRT